MHFLHRQVQVSRPDILHREEFDLLETDHLMRYMDFAMIVLGSGFHRIECLHLRVGDGVGVVIRVHSLHICSTLFDIELVNVILLALMQIDRLLMQGCKGAGVIHFAKDTVSFRPSPLPRSFQRPQSYLN